MNENTIIKFDYTKEALETMKDQLASIDVTKKEELENAVKILVKARGIIQKQGKSFRDEANAYNKSVLEKEKEYVQIIEPLELDYKQKIISIEKEELQQQRLLVLPQRKSLLELLKTITQPGDEILLNLDDASFMAYLMERQTEDKNNLEREEARLKREKEIADNAKIEAEKRAQIEIEKIKKDAENKILEEQQRVERERLAELKRKEEVEIRKKEEQEKLEKNKKYLNFLKENGYTVETKVDFHIVELDNEYILYKKVAKFKK